ncbi:MAG: hypothetical protein AAF989_15975 [Planctomycetota bacterium]
MKRLALILLSMSIVCVGVVAAIESPVDSAPQLRGRHAVGMTHFQAADDFESIPAEELWRFTAGATDGRYVSDILAHPDAVEQVKVTFPGDRNIYPTVANQSLDVFYYVTYPTTEENDRDDYWFPGGDQHAELERMEQPGDEPIIDSSEGKCPLIVFAHGWATMATSDIWRSKMFASHGYIVVNAFFGDQRVSGYGGNLEHPAMRLFMLKAVLDDVLDSEKFGGHIHEDQIGVSGGSFGGSTVMACLGGRIANRRDIETEPRIKAGVATVPWFGAFDARYLGLRGVDRPFMQIYGSADGLAQAGIRCMNYLRRSDRFLIEMVGQGHAFEADFYVDAFNWELNFFNAYLRGDEEAFQVLKSTRSFKGYGDDVQQFKHQRTGLVDRKRLVDRK